MKQGLGQAREEGETGGVRRGNPTGAGQSSETSLGPVKGQLQGRARLGGKKRGSS